MTTKEECEYYGGEWVESYRKRDGTRVEGHCRGRDRDEGMFERLRGKPTDKRIPHKFKHK